MRQSPTDTWPASGSRACSQQPGPQYLRYCPELDNHRPHLRNWRRARSHPLDKGTLVSLTEEQKERYSFIFLVVFSVLLATMAVMISLYRINDSNHKWCQIVNTIIEVPAPKPDNPKADPSRERAWEFYIEFVVLKQSLGC